VNETAPEPKPIERPKNEQVLRIPGHFFFIESVPLPEGVGPAEIASFAELSLESLSPFPVDQLNWGFLHRPGSARLLIFAAHAERLKKEGFAGLEDYAWVLPDFIGLALAECPENTELLFEGEDSLALLHLPKDGGTPGFLVCAPRSAEEAADFEPLRQGAPELPLYASTLRVRPSGIELSERGLPTFLHEAADATMADHGEFREWTAVRPREAELWDVDVRPVAFKKAERSGRRLSHWIARATGWAAVLALALLGAELLLFAGERWKEAREEEVAAQMPAVRRIEDQQSLTVKLEQVAQNELRPIDMLELANQVRLDLDANIEYDETVIEGRNRLTIEGKAGSVNELNSYMDSLRRSGNFRVVGEPKSSTRRGETIFTVTMEYLQREPTAPAVTPAGTDETESEELG